MDQPRARSTLNNGFMERPAELEWGGPSELASLAERGCVLRTVVGSQVHGIVRSGTDDRDEMAICIEPPEYAVGLRRFEHWSYRTQPEGVPSGPGDLDLIVYSLRRFCQLAIKGSPTVLLPLFAPEEHVLVCTGVGRELRQQADLFVGPNTQQSFLGYLNSQRGELERRGSGHGRPRERELSAEHGYDTKYAMHALRIGYQGIEILTTGSITLPVPEPHHSRLMEVRMGEVPLAGIIGELDRLIERLQDAPLRTRSPPADLMIEQWLVSTYQDRWRETWRPTLLE